jgi:hypothetical protein
MVKHEAPLTPASRTRRIARSVCHPARKIIAIVSLHVIAVGVLESTQVLTVLPFSH